MNAAVALTRLEQRIVTHVTRINPRTLPSARRQKGSGPGLDTPFVIYDAYYAQLVQYKIKSSISVPNGTVERSVFGKRISGAQSRRTMLRRELLTCKPPL